MNVYLKGRRYPYNSELRFFENLAEFLAGKYHVQNVDYIVPDTLNQAFELMKNGYLVKVTREIPLNLPIYAVGDTIVLNNKSEFEVTGIYKNFREITYIGKLSQVINGKTSTKSIHMKEEDLDNDVLERRPVSLHN